MNKRIISRIFAVLLAVCMAVSVVPVYAAPSTATENGLNLSEINLHPGDTFTVTYKVAGISEHISTTGFKFGFDKNNFTVVALNFPAIDGTGITSTTVEAANIFGEVSCSHETATGASDLVFAGYQFESVMKVNDDAVLQQYDFTILDCELYDAAQDTSYGPNIVDDKITVTVAPRPIPVTGIRLPETYSIPLGETDTLTVTYQPENATTGKEVTWSSDDEAVAEVDADTGLITTVSEGTANITVTTADGAYSDTCMVTVSCSHAGKVLKPAKTDANCVEQNYDAYYLCSCGKMFKEDGTTEITDIPYTGKGTVHIMDGEFLYEDNGDGTHMVTYACCSAVADAAQAHTYVYTANGAVITETCSMSAFGCLHQATATVKQPESLLYTGSKLEAEVVYENAWKGEKDLAITYTPADPIVVGDYEASITVSGQTAAVSFSIRAAAGEVTITSDISKDYNGDPAGIPTYDALGTGQVKVEYKAKGEEDTAYTETAPTDAGEYTVRVTVQADTNYAEASAEADFTVSKIDGNASITSDITKVYDGSAVSAPVYTVLGDGQVTVEYTVKGEDAYTETAPVNAGEYTVRVSVAEGTNHKAASAEADFTVSKIDGKASITSDITKAYDGSAVSAPAYTVLGDGQVTVEYTVKGEDAYTETAPVNAGEYTVRVSAAEGTNHKAASAEQDFTISKIVCGVDITSDISKAYDGNAVSAPTYATVSDGQITVEYKELGADDSAYTTAAPTGIGEYNVRISVAEGTNHLSDYAVAYFEITKGVTTITDVSAPDKVYDGKAYTDITFTVTGSSNVTVLYKPVGADDSAYTTAAPTEIGKYTVCISVAADANYDAAVLYRDFTVIDPKTLVSPVTPQLRLDNFATTTGAFLDVEYYGREVRESDIVTLKVSTTEQGDKYGLDYKKLTVVYEVEGATMVRDNYDYYGNPTYKDGIATEFMLGKGFNKIVATVYYAGAKVGTFEPFYVQI